MSKKWIGVDLDGTLAYSNGTQKIGAPIASMVDRVKRTLSAGTAVKIFTARAGTVEGREQVKQWLKLQGLEALEVTNQKDFDLLELWDDRARRVIRNEGRFCNSCGVVVGFSDQAVFLTDC